MNPTALELAHAFYGAMASGDAAAAQAVLDAQHLEVVEAESLPYGGTYRGLEGFGELGKRLVATWKRARLSDVQLTGQGDRVFAHFTFSAIARATGQEVNFPVVEMLEARAGRIVSIRPFYWDTHALRAAFGQ